MTEEQKRQVICLRKKGCSYTAIADKVGIPKDTVKSFCRRNGLSGEMAAVRDEAAPVWKGVWIHEEHKEDRTCRAAAEAEEKGGGLRPCFKGY